MRAAASINSRSASDSASATFRLPVRRPPHNEREDARRASSRFVFRPLLQIFGGHPNDSERSRVGEARDASRRKTPAGKLPQAVRTLRSLGELRGAFIEKQAACLSPVRCMPPLPSGERSAGVAGRTGLCTGAECDACEVISVALTASVKKGRPLSADTAFTNVFSFNAGCSAVIVHRETAPMPIPYPSPQKNYSRTGRTGSAPARGVKANAATSTASIPRQEWA